MISKKQTSALLILFGFVLASGIGIVFAINNTDNSEQSDRKYSDEIATDQTNSENIEDETEDIDYWQFKYEVESVNGHSGYYADGRCTGALDKPVIYGLGYNGFDTGLAGGPASSKEVFNWYTGPLETMLQQGFDIIVIDYYDGDGDLHDNAENLAHFINYLDDLMEAQGYADGDGDGHPDYELAYSGFSMGGVIPRVMFAQQNEGMGIDIFATVDGAHKGVVFSNLVDPLVQALLNVGLAWPFIDTPAARQLTIGRETYNEFFGWLEGVENEEFMARVIEPMDTLAVALSNGENPWTVSAWDLIFHTKYSGACSYVPLISISHENSYALRTDFVPYFSAINMDNPTVLNDGNTFWYEDTTTSYFDETIVNDPSAHTYIFHFDGPCPHVHGVEQAWNFISNHWEDNQNCV